MFPQTISTIKQYLETAPNNWQAWLDLCLMQLNVQQYIEASHSLSQARKLGGEKAEQQIQGDVDRRFDRLLLKNPRPTQPQARSLKDIPGVLDR